jgi:hypothetical protein
MGRFGDGKKYQMQIKMVLGKLKTIEQNLKNA